MSGVGVGRVYVGDMRAVVQIAKARPTTTEPRRTVVLPTAPIWPAALVWEAGED